MADIIYNTFYGATTIEAIQKGKFNSVVISGEPSWFFYWGTGVGASTYNIQFTAPLPVPGVYVVSVVEQLDMGEFFEVQAEYTITINVAEQFEDSDVCCDNPMNIAWLNPAGGWSSYIFDGKRTFKVDIGENRQFKDSANILRYSERTNVRDAVTVSSGYVPKHHIDYTAGLRESIQAYLYSDITGWWTIPIIILPGDFVKYRDGQRLYEISFDFVYAEEILIQAQ